MKYLLDTNICIYYLKGKFALDKKIATIGSQNCAISEITVAELLYGAQYSQNPSKNLSTVQNFIKYLHIVPIFDCLPIYAEQKAKLRQMGKLVSDFDLLIAATAVAHRMIMVTNNTKEFERIERIVIQNWVEQ